MPQMIGVPIGNQKRVARMMWSGYQGNIDKFFSDKDRDFSAARSAVDSSLGGRIRGTTSKNEYINQLGKRSYQADLGLGDTDWMDVAKTFVGQIGSGLASKIAGNKPPMVIAPAPAGIPTWAKVGLGVVGVGALYLLLKRKG